MKERQSWNKKVERQIKTIESVLPWLEKIERDPDKDFDWHSQKSAHQAARFIELAAWEMWNLQYWSNKRQRRLWQKSTEDTADE